ncbi:hypothetical protein L484_005133 [Morus notabilis]|uniref:CRC domain-containing protein n=1 Tax=Morus notabilis TaxID=981085 RepID=W9QMH9_9ROSA|nr:hypothetical protein L484_005133 [Morus notabilis]
MDTPPEPNHTPPPPPPPSSQEFSGYYNYTINHPPLPQPSAPRRFASQNNQFVFSSPSQTSDVDQGHSNASLMSYRNNLAAIIASIVRQRRNINSGYVSPAGSGIFNADHVSRPSQQTHQYHHGARRCLPFGTMPVHEGSTLNIGQIPSGLSHNNSNIGASANFTTLNSMVPYYPATNSSTNQPAANPIQTVSSSPDMFTSRTLGMCQNSQERNLARESKIDLARNSVTSSALAVAGETCSLPNNDPSESRAIIKASSGPSTSIDRDVPLSSPMQVTHIEQQIATGSISSPVHTNEVEELNQRKSYCECFKAKGHCSDSCTCKSCQNDLAHEEIVRIRREKIESQNPLAFAPKFTNESTATPANTMEDGTVMTPSSAWHRKGCNCKKSKCAKNYCECFQANFGCSFNCRCDGCHNSFGKKAGMMNTRAEILDVPSNGNIGLMSRIDCTNSGAGNTNQFPTREGYHDMRNYTPYLQPSSIPLPSSNMPSSLWNSARHSQPSAACLPHWNSSPGGLNTPQILENGASFSHYGLVQDEMVGNEIKAEETSQPSNAVQASSPNQNTVQLLVRVVQDTVVGIEIKPEETSQPSNEVQASSPNQKLLLLPPGLEADGPISVASLQPGLRPDRELLSWNVLSSPSHLPS